MVHKTRRPVAFTLIELLTVIAIIGLLAAIIIPTVGKVRRSSMRAQTTSNLRQVHMAISLYANDNKNQIPAMLFRDLEDPSDANSINWKKALINGGYLGAPDHPDPSLTSLGAVGGPYSVLGSPIQRANRPVGKRWDTFGISSYAAGWQSTGGSHPRGTLTDFVAPSRTILVGEGRFNGTEFALEIAPTMFPTDVDDGQASFVFVDGHIERRKLSSLPTSSATVGSDGWYIWRGR
ncbi:prepilin-type N-terminal cleavage/methylation domain-containing protein [Opitutaceae bacterium TAV4]|nr:prepilin-type N-terminal cleavage/methylation domain-containing protein [Opitutaceae bacterium TAV4]RRK02045.1 prepilin-type N-terminal cleavage/methylation domain-containing protein [Opitutaceae bacterium TAV3]